ncbi:MAG: hypothetical protein CMI06_09050 [Oceanospirillaceae bacterium]|nr:hypothetical protein [Oceanospirillaceae bacterium]
MARIRTIKPTFWENEDIASLSLGATLLAVGLLNFADDEGYFRCDAVFIRTRVFPMRSDIATSDVDDYLAELAGIGYITTHTGTDGRGYGLIPTFTTHQRINRKTPSVIRPKIDGSQTGNQARAVTIPGTHTQLTEDSLRAHTPLTPGREGKGRERKGTEGSVCAASTHTHNSGLSEANAGIFSRALTNDYQTTGGAVIPYPRNDSHQPITTDWQPSDQTATTLEAQGIPAEYIRQRAGDMAAHYAANGKMFSNWDAKLVEWIRRDWPKDAGQWQSASQRQQVTEYSTATGSMARLADTSW